MLLEAELGSPEPRSERPPELLREGRRLRVCGRGPAEPARALVAVWSQPGVGQGLLPAPVDRLRPVEPRSFASIACQGSRTSPIASAVACSAEDASVRRAVVEFAAESASRIVTNSPLRPGASPDHSGAPGLPAQIETVRFAGTATFASSVVPPVANRLIVFPVHRASSDQAVPFQNRVEAMSALIPAMSMVPFASRTSRSAVR